MWSDPIADMLTRIRNAVRVRSPQVKMPCSKLKVGIAKVLQEEGYISGFSVVEDGKQGLLRIRLRYGPHGEPTFRVIKRESKPGRRLYVGVKSVPKPLAGLGIAIVSTPKGVLSDRQCRAAHVGGELLCTVE